MSRRAIARCAAVLLALGGMALACGPSEPQTGSQTNWLQRCDVSAECGSLSCICGFCTRPCDDDAGCSALADASCVAASEDGAIAACGGRVFPTAGLCLPRCDASSCGDDATCVAGVCSPIPDASARVAVDLQVRFQTLVGFGASLTYVEDEIVAHPSKAELLDLMFVDSGIDMVRMRNRYEADNVADLAATSEILLAATERMGRTPTTFITAGSPPRRLKASDAKVCAGNLDTCTLVRLAGGEFDYAGFAQHWRDSLEAHAEAGIPIDYLSIQNNPDWVPPESDPADACRFLPVEGTITVTMGTEEVDVTYPGYAEALGAVRTAIADLPAPPRIAAPEVTGVAALPEYAAALDPADVDALAHHVYGTDPATIDEAAFAELGALSEEYARPLFQTEMRAEGMDTAILMQASLALANASTYLQNDFVASALAEGGDALALISLQDESFEAEGAFHALRHFAYWTDPGWVRVDASSDAADLLVSAWLSPVEDALTIVVVNASTTAQSAALDLGAGAEFDDSEVTRTTFDGLERSATLGSLSSAGIVELPGRSILTVALTR